MIQLVQVNARELLSSRAQRYFASHRYNDNDSARSMSSLSMQYRISHSIHDCCSIFTLQFYNIFYGFSIFQTNCNRWWKF